jgi:hypothetical protein
MLSFIAYFAFIMSWLFSESYGIASAACWRK